MHVNSAVYQSWFFLPIYAAVIAQTTALRYKKNHGENYLTKPTKPEPTVHRSVFAVYRSVFPDATAPTTA
jgi:hypothetical protein